MLLPLVTTTLKIIKQFILLAVVVEKLVEMDFTIILMEILAAIDVDMELLKQRQVVCGIIQLLQLVMAQDSALVESLITAVTLPVEEAAAGTAAAEPMTMILTLMDVGVAEVQVMYTLLLLLPIIPLETL